VLKKRELEKGFAMENDLTALIPLFQQILAFSPEKMAEMIVLLALIVVGLALYVVFRAITPKVSK